MNNHDERLHALAPYLLDALEPAERAEVSDHLQGCDTCQAELSSLAGLPGLLARIDPADIESHLSDQPAVPLPLPLPAPRRRWELLAAAAAVVAVLAAGVGFALTRGGNDAAGRVVTASSTSGVRAQFGLTDRHWGTEISVHVSGAPRGVHCVLVAVSKSGVRSPAGTWQALYGGAVTVTTATDLHVADLQTLELSTTDGRRLATARV
jgi:anti-sigma factor RsiW